MLIDNKNELTKGLEKTVYQYLNNNIVAADVLICDGYFTISALAKLYAPIKTHRQNTE
jgi:hypothetical protein